MSGDPVSTREQDEDAAKNICGICKKPFEIHPISEELTCFLYGNPNGSDHEKRIFANQRVPVWGDREPRYVPGSSLVYAVDSLVRFLRNGNPLVAKVTYIYPHQKPPRWDGILQPTDALADSQDQYPDEGDRRIWAYESDILAVVQY